MKKYSKYKNSNIPWLSEIPEYWKQTIAKRIWKKENRPVREDDEIITAFRDGTVTLRKNRRTDGFTISLKEIGYQGIRKNDLVIHQMDAFAGAIGVSDSDGKSTPVYSVCTPISNDNPFYYNYLLREMSRSKYILSLAKGIRERSTDFRFKMFGELNIPLPPLPEQTAITNFLDCKLEKIDRFISKKKQLIELLNEQKAAIINQAVTKGVNPKAKMKPSGIAWLGDIPESWEVKPLKYYISHNDESLSNSTDKDYQLNYIDIGNVNSDGEIEEIISYKFKDAPSRARRIVKRGDVIISTVRTYLKAIAHILDDKDVIVSTGFAVLRPKPIIDSEFLNLAVRANYFIETVCANSFGVSYPAINSSELVTFQLSVPNTIIGQREVVNFIEIETTKISKAITTIEKEIALVEEYKTALIAEAVTGKIDVRDFEIPQEETPLAMVAEEAANYNKENLQ